MWAFSRRHSGWQVSPLFRSGRAIRWTGVGGDSAGVIGVNDRESGGSQSRSGVRRTSRSRSENRNDHRHPTRRHRTPRHPEQPGSPRPYDPPGPATHLPNRFGRSVRSLALAHVAPSRATVDAPGVHDGGREGQRPGGRAGRASRPTRGRAGHRRASMGRRHPPSAQRSPYLQARIATDPREWRDLPRRGVL